MLSLTAASSALSSAKARSIRSEACFFRRSLAILIVLQVALLSHGLPPSLEGQLLQQPFDPLEPVIALDRQMERLGIKQVVAGVEESDHGLRLAEVAPRRLQDVVLPPRLFGRGLWNVAAFAKRHGLAGSVDRRRTRRSTRADSRRRSW